MMIPKLLLLAAQLNLDIPSLIDDLIREGNYPAATKMLGTPLQQVAATDRQRESTSLRVKSATLAIEMGLLAEAEREVAAAESLAAVHHRSQAGAAARHGAPLRAKRHTPAARDAPRRAAHLARQLGYYKIRVAYAESLEALAALEQGDTEAAAKLMTEALKPVPKKSSKQYFHAPRILYAAARVASRQGDHATAEAHCRRGLAMHPAGRDASLGHLTLAEILLAAGNIDAGRQAAETSLRLTRELFGDQHPDAARARLLIGKP